MANTVTNETNEVAFKKSVHSAKTQDFDDECYLVNGPPAKGQFMNSAPSSLLKANKTTNTFIQDSEIAIKRTHWGPDSDPAHAGVNGGVKNGMKYRWEAEASDASKTCIIEDDGVVRVDDPTHQNHKNCKGKVEAGKFEPTAMSKGEYLEKVCQIAWFKGIESGSGRELGWPGKKEVGEPKYLDVFMGSTVDFFSERHDITKTPPEKNPKCPAPDAPHTQWLAKCKKFPNYFDDEEKPDAGKEEFSIEANMAIDEFLLMMLGMAKGDEDGAQDYGHEWGGERDLEHDAPRNLEADKNHHGYDAPGGMQVAGQTADIIMPGPGGPDGASKARERYDQLKDAYGKDGEFKKHQPKITPLELKPVDMKRIFLYFLWWLKPPKIAVTATSCGAARNAEIGVYPKQPLKIGIDLEWLNEKGQAARKAMGDPLARRAEDAKRQAERQMRMAGNQAEKAGNKAAQADSRAAKAHPNDQQQRSHFEDKAAKLRNDEQKALAKFEKAEKNFKQAVTALSTIKKVFAVGEKIARVAGEPLEIRFLDGFGLEVVTGYRQCEGKDSWLIKNKYYPVSQIRQFWEITLEAEPLIGVDYTVNFSLLNFILPFAGQGIGKLLRRAKVVRVDIFFGIAFGVSLGVTIEKDQHDKIAGKFKAQFDLNMSMGLAAGVAGIDLVRFTARIPANAGVEVKGADENSPPGSMIVGEFQAKISCHFTLVVLPDTWFEFEAWSASPKALSTQTNPMQFVILQQPA